jgi:hypothetical protein
MHEPMLTIAIDTISTKLLEARDLAKKSRGREPKKLTGTGAMALHVADVTVSKLKAALELAEETRALIQQRYRDSIPLSEDPKEAADGIRSLEVGGIKVRITPVAGSERFSLKDYKAAGHQVTASHARRDHHVEGLRPLDGQGRARPAPRRRRRARIHLVKARPGRHCHPPGRASLLAPPRRPAAGRWPGFPNPWALIIRVGCDGCAPPGTLRVLGPTGNSRDFAYIDELGMLEFGAALHGG